MKSLVLIPLPRRIAVGILAALPVALAAHGLAGLAAVTFVAGPNVPFSVGFGAGPQSLVLRDMNGDGLVDIVSIDQLNGAVAVLLSQGDATFAAPQSVALDVFPSALAVADLNGDTHADVAVADDDGGVSLLFGDAAGVIRLNEQFDPGSELTDIVAADLDEDGAIDLALLEVCDEVVLQRNRGDGSFDCFEEELLETGSIDPIRIASGDVNGDGHVDLIVLNRAGGNVSLLGGNGDGTFAAPLLFAIGPDPRALAVGRVNDDELDDVVVLDAGFFDENVAVLLGDAQTGLRATEKSLAAVNASAVALANFNSDRCLDFVSPSLEETAPVIGLGDCAGRFAPPLMGPEIGFGRAVQAGDLDGDRRPDFVVIDDDGELIRTVLNQTPFPCAGDCDASGTVVINELVTGVNILLDRADLDVCTAADANRDDRVTVDELVRAVNSLLRGCEM